MQSTGDEGRRENCGCGVCAAYKSYNIPGALEVAVAPREGWRIRTPSIRLARGLIPPRRRSLHKVPGRRNSGFPRDRNLTCVCKAMYNNLKGEATGDGFYGSASAMEPIYKGS